MKLAATFRWPKTGTESPSSARKVIVHFRLTGGAPILRQAKLKISGSDKFAKVIKLLYRHLGWETLNFGFGGKLIVNYACSICDCAADVIQLFIL